MEREPETKEKVFEIEGSYITSWSVRLSTRSFVRATGRPGQPEDAVPAVTTKMNGTEGTGGGHPPADCPGRPAALPVWSEPPTMGRPLQN